MSRWGKFQDVADLPVNAFSESKFTRTYEGGGGGGKQESTSYQTNLPEYAQPYYEEMMARTQAESIKPYQAYGGDRVAGFTPAQQQAQQNILGMTMPGTMGAAEATMGQVGQAAMGQQYTPTTFGTAYAPTGVTSGYQAGQITPGYTAGQITPGYQAGQITPGYTAGTFDAATAAQYMDPYMRQVLDVQKAEAMKEYAKSKAGTAAEAVRAGAFGGGRFGVREAEMESEMLDRLANIEATGMQQAYEQARAQFGAEEAMRQAAGQQAMTAQQQTEAARQAEAQMGLTAQQQTEAARQAEAQMGLTAQQQTEAARQQQEQFAQSAAAMTQEQEQFAANMAQQVATSQEAANQFAAQYGQEGLQLALQTAQAQQNLGQAQQSMELAQYNAQNAVGAEQQAAAQRQLDQAYQDFVNARDYERQQLAFYNALLRGIPVPVQQETIQYQPSAGIGTQLAGLGLAGLGAYGATS